MEPHNCYHQPGYLNDLWHDYKIFRLILSRRTKSPLPTFGLTQCLDLLQAGIEDPFADELSNAISFGDLEFSLRMIEHDHANVSAIVLIDDSGCGRYKQRRGQQTDDAV